MKDTGMKEKRKGRWAAAALAMTLMLSACTAKPKSAEVPADRPATIGEIADYLTTAADDYHSADRRLLIEKAQGQAEAKATRLQALVMISQAFGELPKPTGDNARLAPEAVDLTSAEDWAKADLMNLNNGGVLTVSDLTGVPEVSAGESDAGLMMPETEAKPQEAQPEASQQPEASDSPEQTEEESGGYGIMMQEPDASESPESEPTEPQDHDTITLAEVETIVRRIWSLFGARAQDDFYASVNKQALENQTIPVGQTTAGGSSNLMEETNAKVRALIRQIVESSQTYAPGSNEQKIRDFYRSILAPRNNTAALKSWYSQIDQAPDLKALRDVQVELMRQMGSLGNGLLPFTLSSSLSDPNQKVLNLTSGFMAMTVEDYENPSSKAHIAYRSELIAQLIETGESQAQAETIADAIIAVELEQLKNGLSGEEAEDLNNYNNTLTMEELNALMPELEPKALFTALNFDASMLVQTYDINGLKVLAKHMRSEELPRIKAQMKINLAANTRMLLTGEATPEEAMDEVSDYLSDEVGQLYVQTYFSEEAKQSAEALVSQLIGAFKKRIKALTWMDESTKQEALRKLETLKVFIGYPDEWTENKTVITAPEDGGSYFENMAAIERERLRQDVENQKGSEPTFDLTVYMVNAAANRQGNTLVFPAGILQAPFFDPQASAEENLAGIGAIIAHEISHTFDDLGAQYDADGKVRNWWKDEDYAHFQQLCRKVVSHYEGKESAPGIVVNGSQTLSENIADIGGVASALEVLKTMENPDYEKFFRSYAQSWLLLSDRSHAAMVAASDEHAPKKLRVNEVLKQFQEFHDTFQVKPGDGMYVAPEDRITIW